MPTREMAEHLFSENYELINTAATLLWEHHDELDLLVNDYESRLLLFNRGRTKDDFPYSRMSLTDEEKETIFAAWGVLNQNGASITYHMSLPSQAPVIAIHCGFDEFGRGFGYYYIRPVGYSDDDCLQATVDGRIESNGYSNANTYVEWLPLDNDYWYQGTTAGALHDVTD